ncbi:MULTISPECIES: YchJ family protein [Amycolatopsis]|uniref:YchJ family protein n=1 Tax=Amycolatopsis TaxID=1813 RepID=UPI000B8ACBA1|nr:MULTISPECIES: YchJ family metal-binding protein [Amycolatopsis]OXM63390.1 hypothetical protein CF166_31550 [Amycolatopsis sp. KNN50.9b]
MRCPCGLGETYENCCAPLHRGESAAPTAERLMRARFSAFAVGEVDYLLASWHPDTRPTAIRLDPAQRWTRLEVLATTGGSPFHTHGTVEFRAHYRDAAGPGSLHEDSEFTRLDGRWVYTGPRRVARRT